jgi:glycosyltransferase involved in cell wall biosynthesis
VKILMSALACEPNKGSEPEVGFRAMMAAATRHDVWVLTNEANVPPLRRALASHRQRAVAERVRVEGIDFGVGDERFDRLSATEHHWFYDRWQRKAAVAALHLDDRVDFDVVHHATLASYWTRVGIAAVPKPLVLGPIGGALNVPGSLVPELGLRGLAQEAVRAGARFALARAPSIRGAQRRAAVAFAQNRATARQISVAGEISVLSNALSVTLDEMPFSGIRSKDLLFVGRLLPWKAPILALRALRYVTDTETVLRFCGDGPERARLQRAARQWGLEHRVRFEGWLDRDDLLTLMAGSGALVHPCLREEAGLCVAEALSVGTPLVFLDRGGPAELAAEWDGSPHFKVPLGRPGRAARAMATAIDRALADAPPVPAQARPARTSFERALLAAYDVAEASGPPVSRNSRSADYPDLC